MSSDAEFILALTSYNKLKESLSRARSLGEVMKVLSEHEKQFKISKKIYNAMTQNEIRRLIFTGLNLTLPVSFPSPSLVSYHGGIFTLRSTPANWYEQNIYPFYKYCAVHICYDLYVYLDGKLHKIIEKAEHCDSLDDYLTILFSDGSFAVYFRGPNIENVIFNGHITTYGHTNFSVLQIIMGSTFLGPAVAIPSWKNTIIIIFQDGKEPKEFIFNEGQGSIGSHYFYHISDTVVSYGRDALYKVEDYNKFKQGNDKLPVPIEEIINESSDLLLTTSVHGVREDADIFSIYIADAAIDLKFKEDVLFDTKEMRVIARLHYYTKMTMSFFLASEKEVIDTYTGELLLGMPGNTVIDCITRKLDNSGFDVWIHGEELKGCC